MKKLLVLLLVVATLVLAAPSRTAFFRPFVVHAATFTNAQLAVGALSTTLTTVLYTSTGNVLVLSLTIANNNTTTTRAVTIKAGAGTKRSWVPALAVPKNQVFSFQTNHLLISGDTIVGGQDVGTDVDYWISGVIIT